MQQLTSQLEAHERSKSMGGRLSEEWIMRVILSAPNVSSRALEESFHLSVGSDRSMISRDRIGNIRSAFLEMWKDLIFSTVRNFISVQVSAATGAGASEASPNVVSIYISHVQDEAELRLLSIDPSSGPGLPRRSRTSKVQIHVVRITRKHKT